MTTNSTSSSTKSEHESEERLLASLQAEKNRRLTENQLQYYRPYPKQLAFHHAGAKHRERLMCAGNQLGKTLAGGMEAAMHATGRYPDWWQGRRFDKPTVGWACGVSGEVVKDTVQRILLGRVGTIGTGTIPKDAILDTVTARGIADLVATISRPWLCTLFMKGQCIV
jgi:Terminase large subunit, T4likevirus-type, N-terminal